VDDPVERGIAAAEDHEFPAVVLRGVAHAVVDAAAFELVRVGDTDAPRLEGSHASGDDHGTGIEARAERGLDVEAAVVAFTEARDFLAEMQRRIEGRDL